MLGFRSVPFPTTDVQAVIGSTTHLTMAVIGSTTHLTPLSMGIIMSFTPHLP